jgi:hypothetical protein
LCRDRRLRFGWQRHRDARAQGRFQGTMMDKAAHTRVGTTTSPGISLREHFSLSSEEIAPNGGHN